MMDDPRLHRPQFQGAEHVLGLRGEMDMDGDEVRLPQQGREIRLDRAVRKLLDKGIAADHPHPECLPVAGHHRPQPAHADDTEGLVPELPAGEFLPLPTPLPRGFEAEREMAGAGQQQAEGQLGRGRELVEQFPVMF